MNKAREPTRELWKVELIEYRNRKEIIRMLKKILVGVTAVSAVMAMGVVSSFADEPVNNTVLDAVSGASVETTITDSDISPEISNYMSDNEESKGLLNDNEENKGLLNDSSYIKTDPDSGVSYADYNDWWNHHPDEILSFANTVEESDWDNKELVDEDEMRVIDAHALYQVGSMSSSELHRLMENDFQYKEYEIPTGWIIYGNDWNERWLFATKDDALTYLNTHTINCDYRLYAYWRTYLRDYQDEYIKYVEAYDDDEPIIDEPIIDEPIIDEPIEEPVEDDVIVQTDELTGIKYVNYSDYVGGEKEAVNFLSTIEQDEWNNRIFEDNGNIKIERGWRLVCTNDELSTKCFATYEEAKDFRMSHIEYVDYDTTIECINNMVLKGDSDLYKQLAEQFGEVIEDEDDDPVIDDPIIDEPEEEDDDPVIEDEDEDEDTEEIELGGHSVPAIQCATFFNTEIKAQCTDVQDGIVKVICGSTVNYATFKDGRMINRFRMAKTPKNIVKTIEVGVNTPATSDGWLDFMKQIFKK